MIPKIYQFLKFVKSAKQAVSCLQVCKIQSKYKDTREVINNEVRVTVTSAERGREIEARRAMEGPTCACNVCVC